MKKTFSTDLMFSSKTCLWSTPQALFDRLNKWFCFTVDVCATADNAKCDTYFTECEDGLAQEWEGTCWMNPPYGRGIKEWIAKAYGSAMKNKATVVCLLPARCDTQWWHEYCAKGEVYFIKGRIKFGDAKNNAPFPSALVVFRPTIKDAMR